MNRPADRNHTLILNNTSAKCERSKLELHSLGWMDGRGMTYVDKTSVSRRREGGPAAMGKDGVAAAQARSVARAPRPPSWVQRACLTELLGSRFAQCAAAGRRGYCRPAASSSAARGSRLQHGTRPMRAHACSALSAASLRRRRCPPQLPPPLLL